MDMNNKIAYLQILLGLVLLSGCGSQEEALISDDYKENVINVGGVEAVDVMTTDVTTRALPDSLKWLSDALTAGMNITYYKSVTDKKDAILQLKTNGEYSLKVDNNPAQWLGNGAHTFEGVYVPDGLGQNGAKTYDALTRYTAVPPSEKISATIGKITIPLQHRLARVMAYVLIDTTMHAKLKGYDAANYNAENTMLRFCNVKMLDYVDLDNKPHWTKERKVIPHFLGEKQVDGYGLVPCYDIIVRPTYKETTTGANVMYDEIDKTVGVTDSNSIDFELTLDNGLEYEKTFTFDLDANDETVVYLKVNPERIDYNSAGSRLWKMESYNDSYYGVNNQNGNSLSKAGSSWQRAYTNDTINVGVTDGHYYDADSEDAEAQYVSSDKWIDMLAEAKSGGAHDGKYFILHNDITIDVTKFPEDFVFTGHLDALDHTITLTGTTTDGRNWLFGNMGIGWDAELLNVKIKGGSLLNPTAKISGHVNNCWNDGKRIPDVTPTIPDK